MSRAPGELQLRGFISGIHASFTFPTMLLGSGLLGAKKELLELAIVCIIVYITTDTYRYTIYYILY
jgi:hypothetical protein